jgi:hypothetical protein
MNASLCAYHIQWLMTTGHVHFHKAQNWTLCFLGVTEQNKKTIQASVEFWTLAEKHSVLILWSLRFILSVNTFAYSQITPSSAEIKKEWGYTSVAPVHPHGECTDNFAPSLADIMTPVLPPLISSSLWTQRYWRHWEGSGKIGYFTSFFEFVRQLIGRKKISEREFMVRVHRGREDKEIGDGM